MEEFRELDMVDYAYNAWKAEARTEVQGQPPLHRKFEVILGYMRALS